MSFEMGDDASLNYESVRIGSKLLAKEDAEVIFTVEKVRLRSGGSDG